MPNPTRHTARAIVAGEIDLIGCEVRQANRAPGRTEWYRQVIVEARGGRYVFTGCPVLDSGTVGSRVEFSEGPAHQTYQVRDIPGVDVGRVRADVHHLRQTIRQAIGHGTRVAVTAEDVERMFVAELIDTLNLIVDDAHAQAADQCSDQPAPAAPSLHWSRAGGAYLAPTAGEGMFEIRRDPNTSPANRWVLRLGHDRVSAHRLLASAKNAAAKIHADRYAVWQQQQQRRTHYTRDGATAGCGEMNSTDKLTSRETDIDCPRCAARIDTARRQRDTRADDRGLGIGIGHVAPATIARAYDEARAEDRARAEARLYRVGDERLPLAQALGRMVDLLTSRYWLRLRGAEWAAERAVNEPFVVIDTALVEQAFRESLITTGVNDDIANLEPLKPHEIVTIVPTGGRQFEVILPDSDGDMVFVSPIRPRCEHDDARWASRTYIRRLPADVPAEVYDEDDPDYIHACPGHQPRPAEPEPTGAGPRPSLVAVAARVACTLRELSGHPLNQSTVMVSPSALRQLADELTEAGVHTARQAAQERDGR